MSTTMTTPATLTTLTTQWPNPARMLSAPKTQITRTHTLITILLSTRWPGNPGLLLLSTPLSKRWSRILWLCAPAAAPTMPIRPLTMTTRPLTTKSLRNEPLSRG